MKTKLQIFRYLCVCKEFGCIILFFKPKEYEKMLQNSILDTGVVVNRRMWHPPAIVLTQTWIYLDLILLREEMLARTLELSLTFKIK